MKKPYFTNQCIKKISLIFEAYGYTFDSFHPEVKYSGPAGGTDLFLLGEFFEHLANKLMRLEKEKEEKTTTTGAK